MRIVMDKGNSDIFWTQGVKIPVNFPCRLHNFTFSLKILNFR